MNSIVLRKLVIATTVGAGLLASGNVASAQSRSFSNVRPVFMGGQPRSVPLYQSQRLFAPPVVRTFPTTPLVVLSPIYRPPVVVRPYWWGTGSWWNTGSWWRGFWQPTTYPWWWPYRTSIWPGWFPW